MQDQRGSKTPAEWSEAEGDGGRGFTSESRDDDSAEADAVERSGARRPRRRDDAPHRSCIIFHRPEAKKIESDAVMGLG